MDGIENLIEVGKTMRNFFDDDGLCPYCHAGTAHKSWCVVSLWDEALLSIRIDKSLASNQRVQADADQREVRQASSVDRQS